MTTKTESSNRQRGYRRKQNTKVPRNVATGIYRDGVSTLLVLSPTILKARALIAARRREGKSFVDGVGRRAKDADAITIKGIEREVGCALAVRNALKRFADVAWFEKWLIESMDPPQNVRIATEGEFMRVASVCDYGGIMRDVGAQYTSRDYCNWFASAQHPFGRFPVEQIEQFTLHLYAGRKVNGWLLLPEWAVAFRDQLTLKSLCKAVGVSKGWLDLLSSTERRAMRDAVTLARTGREPKMDQTLASWNAPHAIPMERVENLRGRIGLGESAARAAEAVGVSASLAYSIKRGDRTLKLAHAGKRRRADTIVKIAKAARDNATEQRVRKLSKGKLTPDVSLLRRDAAFVGNWEAVEVWLYAGLKTLLDGEFDPSRKGAWLKRGTLGDRSFLLLPLMVSFGVQARRRWVEQKLSRCIDTSCFLLWFLDSVLPTAQKGRCCAYRKALGLNQKAASPHRNDPAAWQARIAANAAAAAEAATANYAQGAQRDELQAMPAADSNGEMKRAAIIDTTRLNNALQKCDGRNAKKKTAIVQALAELIREWTKPRWPEGKEIAAKAALKYDANFRRALKALITSRAICKRDGRGYWLA